MKYLKKFQENTLNENILSQDNFNDINEEIGYLEELLVYIEMDLERLEDEDNFKLMARMKGIPLDEYVKTTKNDVLETKEQALSRLKELKE